MAHTRYRNRRAVEGRLHAMACIAAALIASSCGGNSDSPTASPSPAGLSPLPGYRLELTNVQGNRWVDSGYYSYRISYLIHRPHGEAVYRVLDVTLFGPDGDTLPGYGTLSPTGPFVMTGTGVTPGNGEVAVSGTSAAHPYAERVRLRLQVEDHGKVGVLTADRFVVHPPQTGRLLEFVSLPVMGGELPGTPVPPEVPFGQPVTVRWNVVSAARVVFETTLSLTSAGGQQLREPVEHAGFRTFAAPRPGPHIMTLLVDGVIKKSLVISVR